MKEVQKADWKTCATRLFMVTFALIIVMGCASYQYDGKEFSTKEEMDSYKEAAEKKKAEEDRRIAFINSLRKTQSFVGCACVTRKLGGFQYGATCSVQFQNKGQAAIKSPTVRFDYIVMIFGQMDQSYTQSVRFAGKTIAVGETATVTQDIADDGMLWQVFSAQKLNQMTLLGANTGKWRCSLMDAEL
ncbi:MAG: hypothetical protein K8S54_03655 [Spirochaetia bacterium]|nr:hypothetical protein [Spirochaetia bacterium]